MTSPATPETPAQSGSQPGGLWFKLPAELRLTIYEYMFPRESVSIRTVRNRLEKEEDPHISAGDCVAILATCRMIYDEAKPILYANTHFNMSCSFRFWGPSQKQVNIRHAQTIDINIELTRWALFGGSANTWLNNLPASLCRSSNLRKIHIKLWTERHRGLSVQMQANFVLGVLLRLKSTITGTITVAMDVSLGGMDFDTERYYETLRAMEVSDKTQEKYTSALAALSSEQDAANREISMLSERLGVRTSELAVIKKDVYWSVRDASKARADVLNNEIQWIADDIFKLHDKAELAKGGMQVLAHQRQLLLG